MALTFNGSSQRASAAVDLSASAKLSVACWLYVDAFADTYQVALEYTADGGTGSGFYLTPDSAEVGKAVIATGNGGKFCIAALSRPSAAAWHHWALVFDRDLTSHEVVAVCIDGVSQTLTYLTDTNPTGNFANDSLFLMARSGGSLWTAGRLTKLALWPGYLLTAAQALSLYQGQAAEFVQPASLTNGWPISQANTTRDVIGGADLTLTGSPTVSADPTPGTASGGHIQSRVFTGF